MRVEVSSYLVFFEELAKKFLIDFPSFNDWFSPKIWKEINPNSTRNPKQHYAVELFNLAESTQGTETTPTYFHKRFVVAQKQKTGKIYIATNRLYRALKYLKFGLKECLKENIHSLSKEQELNLVTTWWEIYEDDVKNFKYLKQKGIEAKHHSDSHLNEILLAVKIKDADSLVKEYFSNILKGKFYDAWDLLSNEFRSSETWNGEFKKFVSGMKMTVGIKDLHAFNIQYGYPKNKFLIYFQEIIYVFPDEIELDSFNWLLNNGLVNDKVLERKFKSIDLRKKAELFSQIILNKYYERYKYFNVGITTDMLLEKYPHPGTISKKRLYSCSMIYFEGRFRLDSMNNCLEIIDLTQ